MPHRMMPQAMDRRTQALQQRVRDAILHKAFDLRNEQISAGKDPSIGSDAYDYVRDSVNTFQQNVNEEEIMDYSHRITNCGKVQKFGVLLTVLAETGKVIACSTNTESLLLMPFNKVIGAHISSIFEETDKIEKILKGSASAVSNPLLFTVCNGKEVKTRVSVMVNEAKIGDDKDGVLFDVEAADKNSVEGMWQAHQLVRNAVELMQDSDSVEELLSIAVKEVQRITEIDRVMIYKFHEDMHGEVVEECKKETVAESLHGLHYPATDIPQINRELFKANRTRVVVDVNHRGDDIYCMDDVLCAKDICLVKSCLRQAHPCHLEYLANMGVRSSFVVAIIVNNELWGLFACHHYSDTCYIPFQVRIAAEFLSQALAARLGSIFELNERTQFEITTNLHWSLCEKMNKYSSIDKVRGLVESGINMCSLIAHTEGGAIVFDNRMYTVGKVPSAEMIRRILTAVLPLRDSLGTITVENISIVLPNIEGLANIVSGVLCVPITNHGFVIWFRPEFRNTVTYAGAPPEEDQITFMGPRASFAAFDKINKLQCRPWTKVDKQAALAIADLVNDVCTRIETSSTLIRINAERVKSRSDCAAMASELAKLLENANAPIFSVDLQGKITQWNKRCEKLSGMSSDAAKGHSIEDFCPPSYHPVIKSVISTVMNSEATNKFELGMYSQVNDQLVELLLNSTAKRDVDGQIDGVVFIGQDITETKEAINKVQKIAEDYCRLFSNAAAPIFGIDLVGKINNWNAAMVEISGIEAEEAMGKQLVGEIFGERLQHVENSESMQVKLEMVSSKALRSSETIHLELACRNARGTLVDLLVSAACRKQHTDEKPIGVIFIAQDITERKTLEMTNRVCLAAEAASAAKTQQMSFLCHEIRNPLNGVIGYITFLEETRLNPEQAELLQTTQQCCLQLRRIVDDVLDLSNIEEGNLEIQTCSFDPCSIISTVMSQVRVVMEDKGLEMKFEPGGMEGTMVIGDPARIVQILSNFAWNAAKFTMSGHVSFKIEKLAHTNTHMTTVKRGVRHIVFSVTDTGPGIPQSVQENLFQPFVQGDKSTTRHHGGTGLGLSICRQLAKLMGGDVSCRSTLGHGSTFQLELPMEVLQRSEDDRNSDCSREEWKASTAPRLQSLAHPRNIRTPSSSSLQSTSQEPPLNRNSSESQSQARPPAPATRKETPNTASQTGNGEVKGKVWQDGMGNSGVSVSSYSSKDTLPHPPQVETVRARASGALGRNWNFVVVREILDDRMAAVLGEIEQGGIRRQCWGTATVEEHGIAALQVATKQAMNACLGLFMEPLETIVEPVAASPVTAPGSSSRSPSRSKSREPPAKRPEAKRSQEAAKELDYVQKAKHILVVDDDPVNTKLASVCLKKSGLQITTASDGKVAVELREKSAVQDGAGSFDLILMDCKMKMMDGDEASKLIRKFEGSKRLPSIPIIAFTGGGVNDKDDEFFFKAGMQGMVQKPLNVRQFPEDVTQCLAYLTDPARRSTVDIEARASASFTKKRMGDVILFETHDR